jgi:site-specific recombinase XerD
VLRLLCKRRHINLTSDERIFVNHRGEQMTRFGVRYILKKHLDKAKATLPDLARKRLHPHSLRHSMAVALLKSGVDLTTISQWLGHASPNTTNKYASIDLDLKRKALARVKPPEGQSRTGWRKNNTILEWLDAL